MLILIHSRKFRKQFELLPERLKIKTLNRLDIFIKDEFNHILSNHPLHGEYSGCRSLDVTGDLRIVYCKIDSNIRKLVAIGTHNQLYE